MKIENTRKKKHYRNALLALGVGLSLTLTGCTQAEAADKTTDKFAQVEARISQLEERIQTLDTQGEAFQVAIKDLEAQGLDLQEANKKLTASNDALSQENLVLKRNSAKEMALREKTKAEREKNPDNYAREVSFTDIADRYGENEIKMMAALGIFPTTEGEFHPTGSITRAEFVRWLVTTNNRYSKLGQGNRQPIRLAEHQEASFTDVGPDHPDFRYIQGMVDAGFVIGYDETTFAPERPLSREELVAIKGSVDYNGQQAADRLQSFQQAWSDSDKISKKYYGAFYRDRYTASPNIERTFGSFKAFRPQKPATRAEAAICLTAITNHGNTIHGPKHAYASEALKKLKN